MDEISRRLQELIDSTGMNNKEFAEKININPSIISHILSGRNKPSLKVIQQITNVYTNVNLQYLLTGEGDLFKSGDTAPGNRSQASSNYNIQEGVRQVPAPEGVPIQKPESRQSPSPNPAPENAPDKRIKDEITNVNTNVDLTGKTIERVIIFYSDKSMEEYRP